MTKTSNERTKNIYCLTAPNGMKYIGQAFNVLKRMNNLQAASKILDNEISRAIRRFGFDNFKLEFLYENIPAYLADELEAFAIEQHDSIFPNGYNLQTGGRRGFQTPEITRQRQSQSHKATYFSRIARENHSIAHGSKKFCVYNKETGEFVGYWINQAECAQDLGLFTTNINSCLHKIRKSTGGYIFRFLDEGSE